MNLLAIVLSAGLMVFLGQQAVTLHRLTVCRQDAWRAAVTLHTQNLLTRATPSGREIHPKCRIIVSRTKMKVHWMRIPSHSRHEVALELRGKL